jgi:hypothetical protein
MDNIRAGYEQEVLRKIKLPLLSNKSITLQMLAEYGITEEELNEYQDTF